MQKFHLFSLLLLACACGYIAGRIVSGYEVRFKEEMALEPDMHTTIPVVSIKGVEEGKLIGSIQGDVRVFLADEQILPDSNGTFHILADLLLMNDVWVSVPEWARFVASKRGTKYYSVNSAAGNHLVPENRVYFATREEAEEAGYRK